MIVVTGSRADTLARLDVFVGGWIVEARFPGDEPAQSSVTGDAPVVRSRPGRKAATAASGSTTSLSPTAEPTDGDGLAAVGSHVEIVDEKPEPFGLNGVNRRLAALGREVA